MTAQWVFGAGLILAGVLSVRCGTTSSTTLNDASTGGSATGGTSNVYVDRINWSMGGSGADAGVNCLPRQLGISADGTFTCTLVELRPEPCRCDASIGRAEADPAFVAASLRTLAESGGCGGDGGVACSEWCGCAIVELTGAALEACQTELDGSSLTPGVCYIDPAQDAGSPALVADCPDTSKRILRFVGGAEPSGDVAVFIGCGSNSL